jgi:membrane protease YdiL (CAAX protease family)
MSTSKGALTIEGEQKTSNVPVVDMASFVTSCLLFSLIVVVAAALITPLVCEVLLATQGKLLYPFSRVYDRTAMVIAIVTMFFMRRQFFIRGGFLRDVSPTDVMFGLCLTSVVGLLLAYGYVCVGTLLFTYPKDGFFSTKFITLLPIALLISTIEEIFFRSVLLNSVSRVSRFSVAAAVSSLLYAFVHFIAPLKEFHYLQGSYLAGMHYTFMVISRILSAEIIVGVIGLWLVGMVLCDAKRRSGSLSLSIGLHAGWIIALKVTTFTTVLSADNTLSSSLGRRYFMVGDVWGWGSFLLVWLVVFFVYRQKLKDARNAQ